MAKKRKKQIARKQKKQNLAGMEFEALMALRNQVDEALSGHRSILEKQLSALGSSAGSLGRGARSGRRSRFRGRKVAPKYRSPQGETWAGRGATPRWLKAAIKSGKKAENFLIEKPTKRSKK
jgi:DNA-binding protein H-NS